MLDVLKEVTDYASQPHIEGLHDLKDDGLVYPYHDDVGYPTIGYGTLLSHVAWEDLSKWQPITQEECWNSLREEMEVKMQHALKLSPCLNEPINAWRLVAITDFIYNLGQGAYEGSTLRKRINEEQWNLSAIEIKRWNRAGSKILKGLDNRRKDEAKWLLTDNEDV